MTNYEVIQTMTVKELANLLETIDDLATINGILPMGCYERWLRSDSQSEDGLLTDEMKKHWKTI